MEAIAEGSSEQFVQADNPFITKEEYFLGFLKKGKESDGFTFADLKALLADHQIVEARRLRKTALELVTAADRMKDVGDQNLKGALAGCSFEETGAVAELVQMLCRTAVLARENAARLFDLAEKGRLKAVEKLGFPRSSFSFDQIERLT